jgi:methyl-accepting chemotaxis protein
MTNLKISVRLYLLIGLMSALLVALGSLGIYGLGKTNDSLMSVYQDRTVPLRDLSNINYLINRNRTLLLDIGVTSLTTGDMPLMERRITEMVANNKKITEIWHAYRATTLTPEEAVIGVEFEKEVRAYLADAILPAAQGFLDGNGYGGLELYRTKVSQLAPKIQELADKLQMLQADEAKNEFDAAGKRFELLRAVSLGAIALGVFIAVLMGWLLVRAISRSLAQAGAIAEAVAKGDLSSPIDTQGQDEVSALLKSLSVMQTNLSDIVQTVRQGADAVSVASNEIAQGNHDLSSRTENQASALEETAASMEELSSTVRQNADNAQQANQLAQSASAVAIQGGEVVGKVVDTMKGINDSSKKIADIISVIDSIAFQTNILALNAAVEAARAGEQGRGFAVVASEVRNLAQRSAGAAKEIKDLINDSVQRVEMGSALVDHAGTTMAEVVDSIKRVNDLMAEISAASREQSEGVSQIGDAVTQMDQVTQQNAALVEQMAAAASSLQSQSGELVQAVAVFKLGGQAQAVCSPAPPMRSPAPSARPAAASRPAPPKPLQRPRAASAAPSLAHAGPAKPAVPRPFTPNSAADDQWESF